MTNFLVLADSILGICGTGINEVRAKCLVGIVHVNRGELRKARDIIFYLEETYPWLGGINTNSDYTNAEQQKYTFETILSLYVPVLSQPEKPLDPGNFFKDPEMLTLFLSLALASVAAYEKMINRVQKSNRQDL